MWLQDLALFHSTMTDRWNTRRKSEMIYSGPASELQKHFGSRSGSGTDTTLNYAKF